MQLQGKSHLICLPAMFLISNKGSLQAANDSLRIFVKQLQEISIFPSDENRLFVVLMSYCTIFDKGKKKRKVKGNNLLLINGVFFPLSNILRETKYEKLSGAILLHIRIRYNCGITMHRFLPQAINRWARETQVTYWLLISFQLLRTGGSVFVFTESASMKMFNIFFTLMILVLIFKKKLSMTTIYFGGISDASKNTSYPQQNLFLNLVTTRINPSPFPVRHLL